MVFVLVLLLGTGVWLASGGAGTGFLPGFAQLLERPQIVGGVANWLSGRSYLTGDFGGRKVAILLQRKRGRHDLPGRLVVSMATGVARAIDSHDLAGALSDRGAESALFTLEARHELRLTHQDGCLKALWQPIGFFIFPGRFEAAKWQTVLEAMDTVADALERRAA